MKNTDKIEKLKNLSKLHKDLLSIYNLIEIEQEALDLCCENGRDCHHISALINIILDKFQTTLKTFETITKSEC